MIFFLFIATVFSFSCKEIRFQQKYTYDDIEECIHETQQNEKWYSSVKKDLVKLIDLYSHLAIKKSNLVSEPIDM